MASLAVKYRPKTFEEICGQESVKKILTRQFSTDNVKNAYIFSGASGSGKTTSARAFAHLINNGQGNPIEVDAASNNGVDNIRDIIADSSLRSMDSKYKVIVIDECHMLTLQSWNALLKTIEEPPKYTVFILCTTEYEKIPDTIKNRCMVFRFGRLKPEIISERLQYISSQEGFDNYKESCDYIAKNCKGQMRDGISLLEKVASYSEDFTIGTTVEILGNYSYDFLFSMFNALVDGNSHQIVELLENAYSSGISFKNFTDQFIAFLLDLELYILFESDIKVTGIPESMKEQTDYAVRFGEKGENIKFINFLSENMLNLKKDLKGDSNEKVTTEVALLRCVKEVK